MKVLLKKPKNQRIYKSIHYKRGDSKIYRPLSIRLDDRNWQFDIRIKDWVNDPNFSIHYDQEYFMMSLYGLKDVYSLKAAMRLIRKWNVPKGTKFIVGLPFIGHDFIVTKD